jgi:hypothetical protein
MRHGWVERVVLGSRGHPRGATCVTLGRGSRGLWRVSGASGRHRRLTPGFSSTLREAG